jgi:hypothetical protein
MRLVLLISFLIFFMSQAFSPGVGQTHAAIRPDCGQMAEDAVIRCIAAGGSTVGCTQLGCFIYYQCMGKPGTLCE